jgi:hypothetical protein
MLFDERCLSEDIADTESARARHHVQTQAASDSGFVAIYVIMFLDRLRFERKVGVGCMGSRMSLAGIANKPTT